MRKPLAFVATIAVGLLASAQASAGDFPPWFGISRAGGFIDVWPAEDYDMAMFGAELQLHLAKSVYLDVTINGAYVHADPGVLGGREFSQAAYGNPQIGAHYAGTATRNFDFYVGGLLTLPFLHDPDAELGVAAILASSIRGFYDADRLLVAHMAIRGMGGFEWNMIDPLYFRAELRPVVYIPTRDAFLVNNDPDFFLEHYFEFEGRLRNGLGFGARLQGVALLTSNDKAQLVFEPFMALTPKRRGFWFRLGFPIALDEPLGWGLDRDHLATVRIALGGQW